MTRSVTLPWPPGCLSPNARRHWSVKAKAAAKARRDACIMCQAAGLRALGWPRMVVSIEFCPPDRRRRDADNMLAASKALLDGLADATGVDDSAWDIRLSRAKPVKGGAVVITISAPDGTGQWQPNSYSDLHSRIVGKTADDIEALQNVAGGE